MGQSYLEQKRKPSPYLQISSNTLSLLSTTQDRTVNDAPKVGFENLLNLWTTLIKSSDVIENGRRLENISWRVINKNLLLNKNQEEDNLDLDINGKELNTLVSITKSDLRYQPFLLEKGVVNNHTMVGNSKRSISSSSNMNRKNPLLKRKSSERVPQAPTNHTHTEPTPSLFKGQLHTKSKSQVSIHRNTKEITSELSDSSDENEDVNKQNTSKVKIQTSTSKDELPSTRPTMERSNTSTSIVRGFSPSRVSVVNLSQKATYQEQSIPKEDNNVSPEEKKVSEKDLPQTKSLFSRPHQVSSSEIPRTGNKNMFFIEQSTSPASVDNEDVHDSILKSLSPPSQSQNSGSSHQLTQQRLKQHQLQQKQLAQQQQQQQQQHISHQKQHVQNQPQHNSQSHTTHVQNHHTQLNNTSHLLNTNANHSLFSGGLAPANSLFQTSNKSHPHASQHIQPANGSTTRESHNIEAQRPHASLFGHTKDSSNIKPTANSTVDHISPKSEAQKSQVSLFSHTTYRNKTAPNDTSVADQLSPRSETQRSQVSLFSHGTNRNNVDPKKSNVPAKPTVVFSSDDDFSDSSDWSSLSDDSDDDYDDDGKDERHRDKSNRAGLNFVKKDLKQIYPATTANHANSEKESPQLKRSLLSGLFLSQMNADVLSKQQQQQAHQEPIPPPQQKQHSTQDQQHHSNQHRNDVKSPRLSSVQTRDHHLEFAVDLTPTSSSTNINTLASVISPPSYSSGNRPPLTKRNSTSSSIVSNLSNSTLTQLVHEKSNLERENSRSSLADYVSKSAVSLASYFANGKKSENKEPVEKQHETPTHIQNTGAPQNTRTSISGNATSHGTSVAKSPVSTSSSSASSQSTQNLHHKQSQPLQQQILQQKEKPQPASHYYDKHHRSNAPATASTLLPTALSTHMFLPTVNLHQQRRPTNRKQTSFIGGPITSNSSGVSNGVNHSQSQIPPATSGSGHISNNESSRLGQHQMGRSNTEPVAAPSTSIDIPGSNMRGYRGRSQYSHHQSSRHPINSDSSGDKTNGISQPTMTPESTRRAMVESELNDNIRDSLVKDHENTSTTGLINSSSNVNSAKVNEVNALKEDDEETNIASGIMGRKSNNFYLFSDAPEGELTAPINNGGSNNRQSNNQEEKTKIIDNIVNTNEDDEWEDSLNYHARGW